MSDLSWLTGEQMERLRPFFPSRAATDNAHQNNVQGYGDHSSDRRATPAALRKPVDGYNKANQHTEDLSIERIQREPQMARAVGQLTNDRELVLQRERGFSR